MRSKIVMMMLLLALTSIASAMQSQECKNLFFNHDDAILRSDTNKNQAIELREAVAYENAQSRLNKILYAEDINAVRSFSEAGCGIPKEYMTVPVYVLSANQVSTSPFIENYLVLVVGFVLSLVIIARSKK